MKLHQRREFSAAQFLKLRDKLERASELIAGTACVYATGSYGRMEAGPDSDLDLFILSHGNSAEEPRLSRLDETLVKANLIEATRALGIPDFDGDGRYLVGHTVHGLVESLGKPEDDADNTLTARLLLVLEGKPLLGEESYDAAMRGVLAAYWRDFEDHADQFEPAFFVNDVLRLWRTFCVNFEARTRDYSGPKRAKRRVKNFKLKHSRMLTCYSTLLCLLTEFRERGTVTLDIAVDITRTSPTERLERLQARPAAKVAEHELQTLVAIYDEFLQISAGSEADVAARFEDKEEAVRLMADAERFGDQIAAALRKIGDGTRLHRIMTV
ncbi:nucleotidyltransferase domain-containing protein [Salinarimonas ramus]|uniref:Polymerase nucleotidyl transferase domain-containing protein n=1 Tax=Salinarimonas ramus TaxID=690164 RepID=A0A917V2P5_9HYPH|nr:nucleotidyltransferase domain-containing protein [Salinarimonas ramus]GGK23398.1 hypothetical protein GCM10011322_07690 [Salinarimonas ramus]